MASAPPMTDEEFVAFCAEHPDLNFEMTSERELIVIAPTYSFTGARNCEIGSQLHQWAKSDARGLACDSSTGFVLPNGARRSPDASWTLLSRIGTDGFWHLCPDFVIELKSDSDRPRLLAEKMKEYMSNGAQLGWLIDPKNRSVTIYRPNGAVEILTGIDSIKGEGPVDGFVLNLAPVWNPLGK